VAHALSWYSVFTGPIINERGFHSWNNPEPESGDTSLNSPAETEIGYGVGEDSGILKISQILTQSID
jgi:hypothetical protein